MTKCKLSGANPVRRINAKIRLSQFFCKSLILTLGYFCAIGSHLAFSQTKPATREAPAAWSKPQDTPNDTLVSPFVSADKRVTFRVYAPAAKEVLIRANSDFFKSKLEFVRNNQGVWSATTEPVSAGAYRYNFIIDGAIVLDNRNPLTSPGAINVQSFVEVAGGPDDIQGLHAGVAHGTLSTVYYDSAVAGSGRRMQVYLPPNYEKGKNYPVLYLIHGGGDDDNAWTTVGRANFILDNLIASGKAKPMVVVFPNGSIKGNLQQVPSPDQDPFIPELMKVIIPYVEANYRVSALPEDRALAGLSRGGNQTAYIGLSHTKDFRYLGIFSSGIPGQQLLTGKQNSSFSTEAARLKLIWFGYGIKDPSRPNAENAQKMLDNYQIKYLSEETPGGHVWANWRYYLSRFAPLLFRP